MKPTTESEECSLLHPCPHGTRRRPAGATDVQGAGWVPFLAKKGSCDDATEDVSRQTCLKRPEQTFVGTRFRALEKACHEGGLLTCFTRQRVNGTGAAIRRPHRIASRPTSHRSSK